MNLRRYWASSTLLRVATVLGVVTLLAGAVVLTAAWFTEQSTGKGVAINIAGSLRMQSYLLATRVADQRAGPDAQRAAIAAEVAGFERRLSDARLKDALPAHGPLRTQYLSVDAGWAELLPLALAAADDASARDRFLERVHPFVAGIDDFRARSGSRAGVAHPRPAGGAGQRAVPDLRSDRHRLLRAGRAGVPADQGPGAVDAGGAAWRVRRAHRGHRRRRTGQLGRDFNHMVEELGRLYGSLEAQIASKTADLAQKNRSLLLLYDTARELSAASLDQATLARVANKVREVLGVEGAVICARQTGTPDGAAAGAGRNAGGRHLRAGALCRLPGRGEGHWHDRPDPKAGPRKVVSVPIMDGAKLFGVLPLLLAPGRDLESWQLELAQTVGRQLGAALSAAEARDEHRRLALLEERSAIARELHDSLAQSLSYTKIQLARLSALLAPQGGQASPAAQAREVVQDLRAGVSTAYRQLRELLTTFRVQLSGTGLAGALQEATQDFHARTGIKVDLRNDLFGMELSANEQIHVLQIVREALSNVEHHARASRVAVSLQRAGAPGAGEIEVAVEDDGVGISTSASPRHHFGLSIMRDRALLLGGAVGVTIAEPRAPRPGTRVVLRFPSRPYRSRAPAAVAESAAAQQAS